MEITLEWVFGAIVVGFIAIGGILDRNLEIIRGQLANIAKNTSGPSVLDDDD